MCNSDVLLLPGTKLFKSKWIYMLCFILIIKYCMYKYACNYMEIMLQNYDRAWVMIVASRGWPDGRGKHFPLYILLYHWIFSQVQVLLFKHQQSKINMNTNRYLVNYEKYFLFLEFVFSDIPKLPYQSKGQSWLSVESLPFQQRICTPLLWLLSLPHSVAPLFEDSLQDPFIPAQKQAFFASRFDPLPFSPQRPMASAQGANSCSGRTQKEW